MKRCAVCHNPDDQKATYEFPAMALEDMWEQDWLQHGCLSEEEGNAPELGLSLDQKQALLAFKNADSNAGLKSLFVTAPNEYATRTMERLNCVQCHSGENTLPDISLAGEKLRTDWLASLFHGDAAKIRPWEEARMPAFASRSEPLSVGLASRAGVTIEDSNPDLDAAKVPMGEQISGLTGYACVTCHAVGSQPALQAFEGQGPNLELSGDRLRYDFYQSWMHWPQRFVPLTIMPKYTTDKDSALLPQFLEGDASDQFEAVWQWMQTLEGAE